MGSEHRSIKDVVRTVRDVPGDDVLVVRCSNGKLGVVHNGSLMPSLEWPVEQLDQCVAFAERFAQTKLHRPDDDGAATSETVSN